MEISIDEDGQHLHRRARVEAAAEAVAVAAALAQQSRRGRGLVQRSAPAAVQSMAAKTTWSSPSFSSKISFTSTDTAVQSGFSCLQCPHLRATAQQLSREEARADRS